MLKGKETDEMNYEEFYSEEMFASIKEDISYAGEWSAKLRKMPYTKETG